MAPTGTPLTQHKPTMTQNYEDMEYGDALVESLVVFIADSSFQLEFEKFFIDNCRTFDGSNEEHRYELCVSKQPSKPFTQS